MATTTKSTKATKVNNKETKKSAMQGVSNGTISAKELFAKHEATCKEQKIKNTCLGSKKSSLYKEELFNGLSDREKKTTRKKVRNMLFSIAKSLVANATDKVKDEFNSFYKDFYLVNDYTLSSVCSENMSTEKKDILSKALSIAKS